MSVALGLIIKYIGKNGPARSRVIAKAIGMSTPHVSKIIRDNGLPRPQPKVPPQIGIKHGKFTDVSENARSAIIYHARPGETIWETVDRLLRGDAKPHPRCSCSLCLRDRERPGDVRRRV